MTDLDFQVKHILRGPAVAKQGEHWKLMEDEIYAAMHDSDLDEHLDRNIEPYEDEFPTFDWNSER